MNKTADYTFTVLVPFYNEEDNIYRLEDSLKKFLEKSLVPDTAVLFVNDGSRDNGQKLVEEICARKDSFFKNLQSKIANGFRRMMTHDNAIDTGCPLKILRTDYAKRIPMFTGMHRFFPALIQLQEGGTMKQVPVSHFPRTAGVSKYHLWNRLIAPFKDCFAYRWMKKRYINYRIGKNNL